MSEEFPTRFVVGSFLTPLALLTFPISLPLLAGYMALRHNAERFDSQPSYSSGAFFSHSYQSGFSGAGPHVGMPSYGFMSSMRSRFH